MERLGEIMGELKTRVAKIAKQQSESKSDYHHQASFNYDCSVCKDRLGYLVDSEVQMVVKGVLTSHTMPKWVECECVKKKRTERLIKSSAITEEFRTKTFGSFLINDIDPIVRQAYDTAYAYVKSFMTIKKDRYNSIALLGRPGTGKTHLLSAVANNLLAKGVEVVYFPYVEGFNDFKSDFDELNEKVVKLSTVEVLFIDDLFKGRDIPTSFQLEQLFSIINYRYINKLPVLISSERDFLEMCKFDEAIGSRLKEMCKGHTAQIKGGMELNYRLRED